MTSFANALKSEVVRLARKEVRNELQGLRKASVQYRSEITELKRKVSALEKQLSRAGANNKRKVASVDSDVTGPTKRFSAKGFATHRKKLGLSAEEAATLLGVSAQTVYGWEKGRKPQGQHMGGIAAFRKLGKREAKRQLAGVEG